MSKQPPFSFQKMLLITSCLGLALIPCRFVQAATGDTLWDVDGEEVGSGAFQKVASDEDGGAFISWEGAGIHVQLLDDTGTAQWASPVQLSATGTSPDIVAESGSGATVVWEETTGIYVQRIDYAGSPQWTSGGVQVATNGEVPLVLHFPGANPGDPPGAFVAWGQAARIAAVNGSGVVTAPGVDGISLGGSVRRPGYMRMISDNAGGAIVVWADFASDIVAQRVNAGLPWGATPSVISNDARNEGPVDLKPDGQGGALISWSAITIFPEEGQIRVQKINSSGASQWTANGIVLVDSDDVGGWSTAWSTFDLTSSVDTDGAGGAIIAWSDWRNSTTGVANDDIYAQRVDSGGSLVWSTGGVLLPPFISGATAPGSQRSPKLVADGIGGAIVTYPDLGGNSWDISATRLDRFGTKIFSNYVFSDFMNGDADQTDPQIAFDGTGPAPQGAIIVWHDDRSGLPVRAQKVEISGPGNDQSANAFAAPAGSLSGTLLGASQDGVSGCDLGNQTTDVWFVFNPPEAGRLRVDTCGTHDTGGVDAGMDSVVSLHTGEPGTVINELSCNDDWSSGGLPANRCVASDTGLNRDSATEVLLTNTDPVWIRVAHYPGTPVGTFDLNVQFLPEPGLATLLSLGLAGLIGLERVRRR
jgi:hypothetical protein